ncbi:MULTISPECIES: ATP-binding cassette domain-containing protein [unclassified Sinorhizobium]|uniref:ATP-binding cassette domain-containing protein n=1 Tax=unclassified Sinorhizobium TaxID=2613772 RepID=UPI0024C22670|nr:MULTISPECIES: ATP-binding cassette domain-containing protein [unclassified Sinorhizobium]MDK1378141.1 ATP-binding cassette domain-containing protein [Sinorhizobium sp. 6-70]MDK1483046.1 ATP-binding cassette domain-containing protein [Sinorhizobium sp. 6-117]
MTGLARNQLVLRARSVAKCFGGGRLGCHDMSLEIASGEVVAIVGESGSGKTTFLRCLGGHLRPDHGIVELRSKDDTLHPIWSLQEEQRIRLLRSHVGFVHQRPRDGLRTNVSAGANIVEPLALSGLRDFSQMRRIAKEWLDCVEIHPGRVDDVPGSFSGGMQQRLQIARSLVKRPSLLLMDEPTGGLDLSVQARILDLLRNLVRELRAAVVLVTHDLGVARMLADRMYVLRSGMIVEHGLADQVLDDPHHPYTQLLVSSMLRA